MSYIINPHRYAGGGGGEGIIPPSSIASLWAYYESDSYSQADGSTITTDWTDLSGNGRHATVGGSPTFETNEVNGEPAINLPQFTLPSMAALTAGEIFVVAKLIGSGGSQQALLSMGTSGNVDLYNWSGGYVFSDFGSTNRNNSASAGSGFTSWGYVDIHAATNDWGVHFNGVDLGGTATNTVAFSTVPKIGYFNGGNYFDGSIAAVYIFSAKLSSGDRAGMNAYIADRYGL